MGVAQKFCCVGGSVSCIGAWGVGTPCALPFIRLALILADSITGCKRFFAVWQRPSRFFVVQRVGVLRIGGVGGPPRMGLGWSSEPGAGRGIRWVPLHSNPPLEADGDLPPCPRWDCCRFHACGRGMVEDCTAAGRMSSCIKYIVFICAFCAKSPLVRMRSPVQIWVAAPKTLESFGFQGFFVVKVEAHWTGSISFPVRFF